MQGRLGPSLSPSRKMICGGCSLSRHQHYCSVGPVRCGVAMMHIQPITVAVIIGFIIGLTMGAVIAGLVLTERRARHWIVYLRLPEELHRRLRDEATDHMCSLKAEIISRLQASFSPPNGSVTDQVVPSPPTEPC
jgi:hypothetical protein